MQKVNAGLNSCDARSEITKYVNNSLAGDIEAACQDIYSTSAEYTAKLNRTLNAAISDMIERMRIYYGEIGSILPNDAAMSESGHHVAISDQLGGLGSMIGDYEGKIDGAMAIGGAGLAALVLTGLGPVGWIIGGVAALVGGDWLFVGSTRDKVRSSVSEKIPEITRSVSQGLRSGMEANYDSARETLAAKKEELVSQYQPVYQELEKRFQTEKVQLVCKIKISSATQQKVEAVLRQINQI
ncbi:MAG: hypothetical protein LUG44_04205 [Clostridiales bacterium]|nr:hypothetical protein [Clostridiales bacterium]